VTPTQQNLTDAYVLLQDHQAALDAETVSVVAMLLARIEAGAALRRMQREQHQRELRDLRAERCAACARRVA